MPTLEEFKQKYDSVLELIKTQNVRLDHLHVQDDKLVIQGAAPNEAIKNEVWNRIKSVDSSFSDLSADISVDSSIPAPAAEATMYTVVAGDSLWKIAEKIYGNGAEYKRILEANSDKLPNENTVIHPGDQLKVPAK